jgi:hypothetical protein
MSSYAVRLRRSLRDCRLKPSLALSLFEEGFSLNLLGFFIPLTFLDRWVYEPRDCMESWGVCYHERSIHLNWATACKVVRMPWDYEHVGVWVLRPDGAWATQVQSYEAGEPDGRLTETHSYRYALKSGEVQERTAEVYAERREWRQRWLMWCPWFAKKRTSIDVMFNAEVGERTGSWKGGCIGCGYDLKPGETLLEALRRMESERIFD